MPPWMNDLVLIENLVKSFNRIFILAHPLLVDIINYTAKSSNNNERRSTQDCGLSLQVNLTFVASLDNALSL